MDEAILYVDEHRTGEEEITDSEDKEHDLRVWQEKEELEGEKEDLKKKQIVMEVSCV